MIYYKTEEEITLIKESSLLVGKTLAELAKVIKPGITTLQLDKIAHDFIRDHGAIPAFLNYEGFPNTLCVSVNAQVVHGIPGNAALKEGDLVSVDCGVLKNEFYGDSAYSFGVGEVSSEVSRLMQVTKECLYKGVEQAKAGMRIGDISAAVQEHAEKSGYSVVRELVGHGLGRSLHEAPEVPNYGSKGKGVKLQEGLVIAIEPMINMGRRNVVTERDGWTIRAADNKPSAHFEHTLVVRKGEAQLLSSFEMIEEVLNSKNKTVIVN
ncbi:MAG: type I methionyl aminopeptidase [Bacteroidetes bacterium]|nr:type I methionyl aminopeptidase [Bacteroidota bacterium]MBK9672040.1 type I methionyl aminopeptidase [Bacteroidota bacterium]MBK9800458.1 type I methionyl aminopeptidase [Bacteroidota bacterium]MBP6413308.1 type I methionyl aminopeptidase [Bacteroidia bacterium]